MRRLFIDTNIYIDRINRGQHEEILFQRDAVKYLSTSSSWSCVRGRSRGQTGVSWNV